MNVQTNRKQVKKNKVDRNQEQDMLANRPIYEDEAKLTTKPDDEGIPESDSDIEKISKKIKKPWWWQLWNHISLRRLAKSDQAKLIYDLDQHYAAMFVLFHQYEKHYFFLRCEKEPEAEVYRLGRCIDLVKNSITRIGNRMSSLGVVPTSTLKGQSKLSYIRHEPEGRPKRNGIFSRNIAQEKYVFGKLVDTAERCAKLSDRETTKLLLSLTDDVQKRLHILSPLRVREKSNVGLERDGRLVDIDAYRPTAGLH